MIKLRMNVLADIQCIEKQNKAWISNSTFPSCVSKNWFFYENFNLWQSCRYFIFKGKMLLVIILCWKEKLNTVHPKHAIRKLFYLRSKVEFWSFFCKFYFQTWYLHIQIKLEKKILDLCKYYLITLYYKCLFTVCKMIVPSNQYMYLFTCCCSEVTSMFLSSVAL